MRVQISHNLKIRAISAHYFVFDVVVLVAAKQEKISSMLGFESEEQGDRFCLKA